MVSIKKSRSVLVIFSIWAAVLCLPLPGNTASLPHHHIEIAFDLTRHKIYGTVDVTLPSTVREIAVGSDLRITEFKINGKATRVEVKDGRLHLPKHKDRTRVLIDYEGIFLNKGGGSLGNIISEEGAFLLTDWYPAAEADLAYFSLRASIPKPFHAVSEADHITTRDVGDEKQVIFDFPHPVSHIHLIMAPYVVNKDQYGDVEIETYLLPEDKGLAARYLAYTKKYLEMYEEMLGPYPFQRFAVVENILPTGYGMPTFTLLGRQVLKLPFIPETSLGHEILHSWFGNSVYVDYEKGNWSEGLTSYLADHYYTELEGKGWQYRKKIIEDFESYVHEDNEIRVRDFTGGGDKAVRAVGYGKVAMIFHMLKTRIGDEAFQEGLELLVQEQRFRLTSWQDIEAIFSRIAQEDLSGFFDFWLDSKGAMEVNLNPVRLRAAEESYKLEFKVRLMNSPKLVSIPVIIQMESKKEKQILSMPAAERTLNLTMDKEPEEIIVDPDYDLFRSLTPEERRPVLSRLLGDPTRTIVLPESNREVYELLIQELEGRGFKTVPAAELDHAQLAHKTFLFLGVQSELKSLFPGTSETPKGFSLMIRKNRFNPKRVLGLVLAENSAEVNDVAGKLFHYGKYSSLKFSQGKNVEKEITAGHRGIQLEVPQPITGISLESVLPLSEIISQVADKTIVYVGEKHDRYGDHLVQLEVIRRLHQQYPRLAIGMEMFQRRYQKALDDYISGKTDSQTFLKRSRYFTTWRFSYHLYEDILQYARANKIPVVALNQNNELVSKVADEGLENLSKKEKGLIPAELNFDDKDYEQRLRGVFEMHQTELPGDKNPQVFEYFHQAQILWDETMAESIATFLADHPDHRLVVLAGNGHLAFGSGIPKRAYRRTGKDYAIVLPDPGEPLEPGLADFVLFPNMVEAPPDAKLGVVLDRSKGQFEVNSFVRGSGAEEAGMEKGDILLAIDGQEMESFDDIMTYLATKNVGDWVQVKVKRGKKKMELKVKLGAPTQHGR